MTMCERAGGMDIGADELQLRRFRFGVERRRSAYWLIVGIGSQDARMRNVTSVILICTELAGDHKLMSEQVDGMDLDSLTV